MASLQDLFLSDEYVSVINVIVIQIIPQLHLRLFELLLSCDGVGEIDLVLSELDGFICDMLLAFSCSCCRVCKFLLVNCMAVGLEAVGMLFVGEALWPVETAFNDAIFETDCGVERVMQT